MLLMSLRHKKSWGSVGEKKGGGDRRHYRNRNKTRRSAFQSEQEQVRWRERVRREKGGTENHVYPGNQQERKRAKI